MPANKARKPSRTIRRGETWGKSLGTPTAASRRVSESGSKRTPVATAESPSATERNSGTVKNSPACRRYWKKNEVRPARNVEFFSIAGFTSGSARAAIRRFSQAMNSHRTSPPPK